MTDAVVEAWLTRLAKESAVAIDRECAAQASTLAAWAADAEIRAPLRSDRTSASERALSTALDRRLATSGDFALVLVVDASGRVAAARSADRGKDANVLVGVPFAELEATRLPEIKRGDVSALPRSRPAALARIEGSVDETTKWCVGLAAPLIDDTTRVGYLVAYVRMAVFQRLLDGVESRFSEPTSGALRYGTGYPFLFDQDADTTIAHSHRNLIGTRVVADHGLSVFRDAMLARGNGFVRYEFPKGNPKTAGFAATNPSVPGGRTWFVGVGIDDRDIYRGVKGVVPLLIGIGIGTLSLALAAAWWWAGREAKKLRAIALECERLASGEESSRTLAFDDADFAALADALAILSRRIATLEAELARRDPDAVSKSLAQHIAHEIKNGFTPIVMAARQLSNGARGRNDPYAATVAEYAKLIEEGCDSIRRFHTTISQVGSPPARRLDSVDLRTFLDEEAKRTTVGRDDVRVETAFDLPPDARIRADRDDLRRVLMNLVNNAVEAMNGKGTLRFRARIETGTTPTVRIDLEDTGCGIAPADMDRLFLPNFSTRTSGTGLGLFYSRKIVRDHGGDITATSVLGEGSVFTVTLPLDDGRSSGSDDAAPTETIDIAR